MARVLYRSVSRPDSTSGMAIYASRQNGAIVSETSVPLSPLMTEGRIYASVQDAIKYRQSPGLISSGSDRQYGIFSAVFQAGRGRGLPPHNTT